MQEFGSERDGPVEGRIGQSTLTAGSYGDRERSTIDTVGAY
jgi:hypothetical protein